MTPHRPSVFIVIVAYEHPETLSACLASLDAQSYRDFRVFVVDNSPGEVVARALAGREGLEFQRPGKNLGFSRAVNLGLERAVKLGSSHALILNPDTVLEPECLGRLVEAADSRPEAGIVCGRIHYASDPDTLWFAGGRLSLVEGVGKHFREDRGALPREVTYATGCCMLVPRYALLEVGFLNPAIFMYLDDAEYCLRMRRRGYRIWYVPGARLAHEVGAGTRRSGYPPYYLYFSVRNKPLVAESGAYRVWLRCHTVLLAVAKLLVYGLTPRIEGRGAKLRAIVLGAWDAFSAEAREEVRFPDLFRATPQSVTGPGASDRA